MGHMGGLINPPPRARTIPSRFFKYRWVSQASKEGTVSKKAFKKLNFLLEASLTGSFLFVVYVCMLKVALAVLPVERCNPLGQGERPLSGPIFPTPRSKLDRGTRPTAYPRQSAGSTANFALGLTGLLRGHRDQSGIPRPSSLLCVYIRRHTHLIR